MTVLNFAFAFVLMLGVLITVHEFGHFIVAKLCGVRVLKFSIGFGSPIGFGRFRLRFERGGTEYVVAWIPLGGFVKMLGEQPGEEESPETLADPAHALGSKSLWQKLAVVLAGPAMNLVLPVLVFAGMLAVGTQRPAPVVGAVEDGSPAAALGFAPGDRILTLNGEPVAWWDEFEERVREHPGETLQLGVERDGQARNVELDVVERTGMDIFRQPSQVGWLGLRHRRQRATIGIPEAGAPALASGLRSGDRVTQVGATAVEDWSDLAAAYADSRTQGGAEVEFTVERGPADARETVSVTVPALASLDELGVVPATVLISQVNPGSPASEAGLAPGDLILAVDGQPVGSFASFAEIVRSSQGRTFQIAYARDGETRVVPVAPRLTETETPAGTEEVYMVGIGAEDATLIGAVSIDRERNPLVSIPRAVAMTADITGVMIRGISKIITGEISRNQIGGPIEIAKQAHQAMELGWSRYLNLLVLISINLALLNLLPIPVLDGGQGMLFVMEGIKRGPLSLRTREIAMQIGVTLVVALMGFAFWNDLSRNWSKFLEWMRASSGL